MKPAPQRAAAGGELWLLAAPAEARAAELAGAFAGSPAPLVYADLAAPSHATGTALARALSTDRPCAALPRGAEAALATLLQGFEAGASRLLAVLPPAELAALVAHALGLGPERAAVLRVDPGRLTLLRHEPDGLVLRRANVLAPESESGTALPTGRRGAR